MYEFSAEDLEYMKRAVTLAQKAAELGEVPVGAVVVCDGEIVGEGFNYRECGKNALYHAELIAIDEACKRLHGWRLHRCTLYVTLEPCPMCAGAIVNSRMKRVVFGVSEERAGALGSILDMNALPLNHTAEVQSGLCEDECRALMQTFFQRLREKRKKKTENEQ